MKTTELLKKAKRLILNDHNFTTGALARRRGGYSADISGPDAVCWCLLGAVMKIHHDATGLLLPDDDVMTYLDEAAVEVSPGVLPKAYLPGDDAMQLSDRGGHAIALLVLDKAVEIASKDEAEEGVA